MRIEALKKGTKWKGDSTAFLMHEGEKSENKIVASLIERKDFSAKKGSMLRVPVFEGDTKNFYIVGLGKKDEKTEKSKNILRNAVAELVRKAKDDGCASLLIQSSGFDSCVIGEAVELGAYDFDKYKTKKDDDDKNKKKLETVFVSGADDAELGRGKLFACSQNFARDLANEPGNAIYPEVLAEQAKLLAEKHGLECEIWDEERILKEKMGCLHAVGRGSKKPPRFIHIVYRPSGKAKSDKKIALVGKGLTFDSGGIDLKSADFLRTMKGDKSGACNVLGVMRGCAKLKPHVEVHGIIAAAENMPDGDSFRPDDILVARNGKTIEIDNTDAEGRLVLADALVYASELKPDAIIDMATLTGACAVALGSNIAGLFSNDDTLANALLKASEASGERLWRMPADDEKISESMKSPIADIVNGAGRYGGAIFAAIFLQEFIDKKTPWAHLDIAGVDFFKEKGGVYSKGASAFAVRTCLEFLCA